MIKAARSGPYWWIKELFLEAAGILMEKREEIIGDCRAVMEALVDSSAIEAELEAVSREK